VETGVLWLARRDDGFEAASAISLAALDIPAEHLTIAELNGRWPQLATDGLAFGLHEPEAGVLHARRAVTAVADAVSAEGGSLARGIVALDEERVVLDSQPIATDAVVFAAGPWLPVLLGPLAGLEIGVPQQEIIFFATPPGDRRFDAGSLPTWVDYDGGFYGMPSIEGRGFKVAPDWPGPQVDPDRQDRRISDERVDASRAYLRERFPDLGDQPVSEGRVCQYEVTADTHFVIDRHPSIPGAWIVGGGSGHGFKHGPAVGEYASALVLGIDPGNVGPSDGRFDLRPRTAGIGMRTGGDLLSR